MLYRTQQKEIIHWIRDGEKALLVSGARQIGKTYLIRSTLKEEHRSFIELNFIEEPDLIPLFAQASSAKDLLLRLSVYCRQPMIEKETIFFLDEIQEYKEIMTKIKFLVEEGSYRYIMSGSLLGVELHNLQSAPVGYVSFLQMFPLDFYEFLIALGVQNQTIDHLKQHFLSLTPVDAFVHEKILDVFYLYLIVGGMPDAVVAYLKSNNLQKVKEIHSNIIALYKIDFTKYEEKYSLYVKEIYETMASELNSQNKRFKLNTIKTGISYDRMKNNFLWLKDAGVALPVYNIEQPNQPIKLNVQRNLFKLFYSDVGLLTSQYPDIVKMKVLSKEKDINNGALFENMIAQELYAHQIDAYYYTSKKYGELDFVIELDGELYPLEIKSGKDYKRHNALNSVLSEPKFAIQKAFILSNANVDVQNDKIYLPIYMISFFRNTELQDVVYKIDTTGL